MSRTERMISAVLALLAEGRRTDLTEQAREINRKTPESARLVP